MRVIRLRFKGPDGAILGDLELPGDGPLGDLLPQVRAALGLDPGAGWGLTHARTGAALEEGDGRTAAELGLRDGDLVHVLPAGAPPPPVETPPPPPPEPEAPAPIRPLGLRLGFYGTRGGVGVSSASLSAARALAGAGRRVVLIDATGRGDLHLMAGLPVGPEPVAQDGVTFLLGEPDEEALRAYDAVVIDGGREERPWEARWVALSRPLSEERVLELVGLAEARRGGLERLRRVLE